MALQERTYTTINSMAQKTTLRSRWFDQILHLYCSCPAAMIVVLYASETGNTEEVAYDLQEKLQYPCHVMSIKDYDVTDLPSEKLVVFVVSTTGDGEPPEPMKPFWKFLLRKGLSSDALSDTSFALFGLGDSSYEKYNAVARKLQKRLCMLGAKEAVSTGYGDDQAPYGYLSAYFPWLESLNSYLHKSGAQAGTAERASSMQSYTLNIVSSNFLTSPTSDAAVDTVSYIPMRVSANRRQTADVWPQDVRHIRLDTDPAHTSAPSELYKAGDVAIIPYENPSALVEQAAAIIIEGCKLHGGLELSIDTVLNVTCNTPPGVLPRPSRPPSLHSCSLRTLLTSHLDIGAVPKRSYFSALAKYASDPEEAEKLQELASAQGTDLYFDYCARERKTYVEVLQEFRSCRPPLAALLAAVPVIAPRKYSIASAPQLMPHSIELCVAVSVRRTPYGRKRVGLCSGYLAQLQVGDTVRVAIQRGAIHGTTIERAALPLLTSIMTGSTSPHPLPPLPPLPPAEVVPLILIGPGTGVAPMRALIAQHCVGATSATAGSPAATAEVLIPAQSEVPAPRVLLFFGCRKAQRDNLFGDEWAALNTDTSPYSGEQARLEAGSVRVISAFSQDQDVKEYVTHRILANAEAVWAMLQAGAAVFVAGSAKKMPADVRKALCSVLQRCGRMSEAEAEQFLGKLAAAKKYVAEGWS